MQEENIVENMSEEKLGGVQNEEASMEVNVDVSDILPSNEVIDILPTVDSL